MNPIEFVHTLLKPDEELLYLTYFGSHLYGTASSGSDIDLKGIFLPSKQDLLLMNGRKSINWKSGDDNDKNSSEDTDVELWSIHYFIELIGKGDTGAIDLLFSPSNTNTLVYKDGRVDPLFDSPLSLFDPREVTSLIGYIYGQMKKYGIKYSRLGTIKDIYKQLDNLDIDNMEGLKLGDVVDEIVDNNYHESYCFTKKVNGEDALVVCGKVHLYSIKLEEFYHRIKRENDKYGHRANLAEQNEGIDWKCVMHSYRCAYQMVELLEECKVTYPLRQSDFLKRVKNGEFDFKECEDDILDLLEKIDRLKQDENSCKGERDEEFIRNQILEIYK